MRVFAPITATPAVIVVVALTVTFPPENVAKDLAYLRSFGPHEGFDVAVSGVTPAGSPGLVPAYAEVGATWWFESLFGARGSHAQMLERVTAGPPG